MPNVEREFFKAIDKDRDGDIGMQDFEWIYSMLRRPYLDDAKLVFEALDKNRDGLLDYYEFHASVRNPPPPGPEAVEQIFIKDAMAQFDEFNTGNCDAAILKEAAFANITDAREIVVFEQMCDRHTKSDGTINIDNFVAKLGLI